MDTKKRIIDTYHEDIFHEDKLEESWKKFQKLELMSTLEESSYYSELAEGHQVSDEELVKSIVGDI